MNPNKPDADKAAEEKYKNIESHLGKRWADFVREWDNNPIDYSDYKKLAEDCWLFLTSDKMPARANIKKDAFLHEVGAMIETAVLFNNKTSQSGKERAALEKIVADMVASIKSGDNIVFDKGFSELFAASVVDEILKAQALSTDVGEQDELCSRCGKEKALELHSCPYKSEINDDDEFSCNCCESCTHECAMDI